MKKKYVKPMTEVTEVECLKPLAMSDPTPGIKKDPSAGGAEACNIWGSSRSAIGSSDNSNGKGGLWGK